MEKEKKKENFYYTKVFCANCGVKGDEHNKKIPIKMGTTILNSRCPNCGCDTLHRDKK